MDRANTQTERRLGKRIFSLVLVLFHRPTNPFEDTRELFGKSQLPLEKK